MSEHLGLSMASISRVLNGSPAAQAIPKATQARILEAAREFNYRPNQLARSLRSGQSTSVGVLIPEISEGYAAAVLAGIEETLSAAGYAMMMITHHHRAEVLERSERLFAERAVDAVIAVDTALPLFGPIPTVTVSCPDAHPYVTNIVLDNDRAAEIALQHLHALGHRRIAIIKGQPFSSETEVRWRAIERVAASLGLPLTPGLVAQMEEDLPSSEPGYRAACRLLKQGGDFSALFAFNDVSAIGAIAALLDAGRSVPEDVSVLGFDDIALASIHRPALTTVRQPLHHMGVLAANAVLEMVNAGPDSKLSAQQIVVAPELVIRSSTRACHGAESSPA
ncbi:LacI family DNA-binding transcriptional regulator [Terriglobus sp.]|uniref:LacI family DNA-binding transcriptional regulator n=1 Tax=Terriglobus sp. TaxID=1889013 RepID=UPI003B005486